jgi:hypothetical protein
MSVRPTPLGAIMRGAISGALGTAAVTRAQRAQQTGGGGPTTTTRIATRVAAGVLERPVADERSAEQIGNAVRWACGTGLGALYGAAQGTLRRSHTRNSVIFAGGLWGAGLLALPVLDLAPPVKRTRAPELAAGGALHLLYGVSVGLSYALLSVSRPRPLKRAGGARRRIAGELVAIPRRVLPAGRREKSLKSPVWADLSRVTPWNR